MEPNSLIKDIADRLRNSSDVSQPELEARWIVERALGKPMTEIMIDKSFSLETENLDFIEQATRRRLEGQPLAYVLGEKDFYGITFAVNANVLIPRPETELLVDKAIAWMRTQPDVGETRILDLGCGSGCVGLSLLVKQPQSRLIAVDVSVEALDMTDFNSKSLGVHERTNLLSMDAAALAPCDLPKIFQSKVDVVVANPPYIDPNDENVEEVVRNFEPALALFSDENGLGHLRRWARALPELLADKAFVAFEIGYLQGKAAKEIFESLNVFNKVEVIKDYSGHDRVVLGYRGENK